ncbi:MAG: thiamine ABC transporter substrate-binding protein [Anaerolineales bacterium]|nr:thiamine ABC transporter substrate-binding protein [Anaerolineales bacterium]
MYHHSPVKHVLTALAPFRSQNRRTAYSLLLLICILLLAISAGCSSAATASSTPSGPRILRVMTHDSFAVSEDVLIAFEQENNVKVQIIKSGDTGTALNKAILSKDNPLADVFYGVDNTFLSRALDEGIFEPYASKLLEKIPAAFQLDEQQRALPVDYGDVCLNYDKAYFAQKNMPPPTNLEDLTKAEYKSLLVVQNPATSSPGLAFLLATIGNFGPTDYLDFWKALVANDVLVVNDWETAYYTEFSGSSGKGPRPIVVSYNSSPAFELIYASSPMTEPPTGAIVSNYSCFRQIEFVGILKGASNHDLAEKWIDFMLSPAFQADMPMQMFVFPVNPNAQLSNAFVKYLDVPQKTAVITPQEIAANREKWLQAWTEAVLR